MRSGYAHQKEETTIRRLRQYARARHHGRGSPTPMRGSLTAPDDASLTVCTAAAFSRRVHVCLATRTPTVRCVSGGHGGSIPCPCGCRPTRPA